MDHITETYKQAETYIYDIPRFTRKNPPESTKCFFQWLGKPGEKSKIIHIAGTNGKGSVCAYLNGILRQAGYKTAMFTSPHLVHMLERFQINGRMVSEAHFLQAYESVLGKVKKYQEEGNKYRPTFFEFLFFIGMVLFEEEKPDYIILETGLGGRLDATNVIEHPIVSIITKIGKDHCEYLGDTLEQIAGEKAGIIKQNCPVVYLDHEKNVSQVIRQKAKIENSQIFPVSVDALDILRNTDKSIDFSYKSKYYDYIKLTLSTCARYQCMNAALAIQAVEVIDQGRTIQLSQIQKAVEETHWEGRMEEVLPGVIVDGAHNEDGIEAFLDTVQNVKLCKPTENHLLFAVVNDKDYTSMVKKLMESQLFTDVTITKITGSRELSLDALEKIFLQYTDHITRYEDVNAALQASIAHRGEQDRVYIVGSLYLVGLVKEIIERHGY